MNIDCYHGTLEDLSADLLLVVLDDHAKLADLGEGDLNDKVEEMRQGFVDGKFKREMLFDHEKLSVMVCHSRLEKGFTLAENLKTFVSRAGKLAGETGRETLAVALNGEGAAGLMGQAAEGALIGAYKFDKYKSEKSSSELSLVLWGSDEEGDAADVEVGRVLGNAVNVARDLICEPADVLTPAALGEKAEALAEELGFECEIWDEEKLAAENYIGLCRVGAGSEHPPRLIQLSYEPEEALEGVHVVLLGKGVTFDTGGISIKPADKMHLMKGDMSGAAAVFGAMDAIGRLKPKVKVTMLIVAAENSPDGKAYRPGDILVYRNGKSVHIGNTDAEGRLCLADGLLHSGDLGATHIIDVATLTGSCARALGPSFTGVMGANRKLVNAITRAGGNRGESYWKLPLPLEYKELLKSAHADIENVGGPSAGAITAGLFLKEFVPPRVAWAHLDIAGTFWKEKPWKYYGEGPSGTAVKTLADLVVNWEEHLSQ